MKHLKKIVKEILADPFTLHLAVSDTEGPWSAPLIYVFDEDLNLYWVSLPSARHSLALEKNSKAACSIIAEYKTDQERALQIQGAACKLAGNRFDLEIQLQRKRGKAMPPEPGEILRKGYAWYKLTPSKIELIHNANFGYERQRYL